MGQGRAQIRIQTTKPNNGECSIERVCVHSTAAPADAVSPRRHRQSRYMLCITSIMYSVLSPQPSVLPIVRYSSELGGSLPSLLGVCICSVRPRQPPETMRPRPISETV